MPVELAGERYKTQKELVARLRALTKNTVDVRKPANQALVVAAVARYGKVVELGAPVERVYVDRKADSPYPEMCLHVMVEGGAVVTVAADKVARSAMSADLATAVTERRKIDSKLEALRTAILPDVQVFKASEFAEGSVACALCGVLLRPEEAHADHHGDSTEFRHLVDRFATKTGKPLLELDESAFVEFHAEHMRLQLTCKTCNLRKPKKRSLEA